MRFIGKKKNIALSALYRNNVRRFAPAKFRMANRRSGSNGAAVRFSMVANAISETIPTRREPTTYGFAQVRLLDSVNAKMMPPKPAVARIEPIQSGGPEDSGFRLSGTCHTVINTTTAATGKLIRNAARQD